MFILGYAGSYRNNFTQVFSIKNNVINAALVQTDASTVMRIVLTKFAAVCLSVTRLNHQKKYTSTGIKKICIIKKLFCCFVDIN